MRESLEATAAVRAPEGQMLGDGGKTDSPPPAVFGLAVGLKSIVWLIGHKLLCQLHRVTAKMADVLVESLDVHQTEDPAQADILLLNTCSIREKAQEKVSMRQKEAAIVEREAELLGDTTPQTSDDFERLLLGTRTAVLAASRTAAGRVQLLAATRAARHRPCQHRPLHPQHARR